MIIQTAMDYHPGGAIICMGKEQDSTEVFNSIHSPDLKHTFLPQFCIGYILDIPAA